MEFPNYAGCVLLADSHHALSEGIRRLLSTSFSTVVMVADESSLLEAARRLHCDFVIIDISLPKGNCIDFLRAFRKQFDTMKIIILGVYDMPTVAQTAIQAGANGYVVKRELGTDLLDAVDAVLNGHQYVSPAVSKVASVF